MEQEVEKVVKMLADDGLSLSEARVVAGCVISRLSDIRNKIDETEGSKPLADRI